VGCKEKTGSLILDLHAKTQLIRKVSSHFSAPHIKQVFLIEQSENRQFLGL